MSQSIYVVGWYGNGNLGDEAFKQCFQDLWGAKASFTFGSFIPDDINLKYSACFIGGGSFLDQPFPGLQKIKIPIGFIGVGIHDFVHKQNLPVLNSARLIVARNANRYPVEMVTASDLIFGRKHFPVRTDEKTTKTILVLGNSFLIPGKTDPYWKHTSLHWFINDFSDVLNDYIERGYQIEFYPMATSGEKNRLAQIDDRVFAYHVVSQIQKKDSVKIYMGPANEKELFYRMRCAELIISFRFHGNIFSTILGKPFVGITCHDKMKSFFLESGLTNFVDYYGFNKKAFEKASTPVVDIQTLKTITEMERNRWRFISDIVAERFNM
jgi:hypothetical protein